MKRYMIFHGDNYYACGGMNDYRGTKDTLEEAFKFVTEDGGNYDNWAQIYDTETQKRIDAYLNLDGKWCLDKKWVEL